MYHQVGDLSFHLLLIKKNLLFHVHDASSFCSENSNNNENFAIINLQQ
jgi:hypothetical protein